MEEDHRLVLGPPVYSSILGGDTPSWIATPEGFTFDWNEETGSYPNRGPEPLWLYMEAETISPYTWYEISPA